MTSDWEYCPICRSEDLGGNRFFGDYAVAFCSQCGHGVTLPLLDQESLTKLYTERYFSQHFEYVFPRERAFKKKIGQEAHRVRILRQTIPGGNLLDVGCGMGYFLYACKQWFSPYGYDIANVNKQYITDELRVPLIGSESELQETDILFDAVTFWHSLEHFSDPFFALSFFSKKLRDDGFMIIDVPRYHSVDAYMEQEKWPGWDLPFHRHHFTSDSLNRLLRKNNLRVESTYGYFSGYVRSKFAEKIFFRPFARSMAKLFSGSSMVVVCRRNPV